MIDLVGQERTPKSIGSYRSSLLVSSVCTLPTCISSIRIKGVTDEQESERSSYSKLSSPTYPTHIPRN
jgi:hypothetical protein